MDSVPSGPQQNRLAAEASPYLRQHAANPVDWHPWGPEALERARREHLPILLSVGYAACHWCHVMAHESFEDPATAALMNEHFVNIKVDREERPDLDRLYQLAQQMLTGRSGGWPLTLFLMHDDQRPFFGGTYFPAEARYGLPAFRDLLQSVAAYYREHEELLRDPAARIVAALDDLNPPAARTQPLDATPLATCRQQLQAAFDTAHGGFGGAPKFPHPASIARLLRDWYAHSHTAEPDLHALYMATLTLTRMAEGGLFDQLGGGFFRYSVDERWEIPHFEKMLYDNGQLLGLYAEAALATGEPLFRDVAVRTGEWLLQEMRTARGGLCASLDADSEGHEGRYYVWDATQVRELLGATQWPPFAARYGLDRPPNFEGHWHLIAARSEAAVAQDAQRPEAEVAAGIATAAATLRTERARRVRPGLDDKLLTSWNALGLRGLAVAARTLGREDFGVAATAALDYLRAHHWRGGRLLAVSVDRPADPAAAPSPGQGAAIQAAGALPLAAYLDDHVFLIDAILELQSLRFRPDELRFAIELAECVLQHFEDTKDGGFYFTADDHEALISRPKSFGDDALPAGNAVAVQVLQRLGHLLGETRYLNAAELTLRAAWPAMNQYPPGHAALLNALEEYLDPPQIVILRGPQANIEEWRRQLSALYAPHRWILAIPDDATDLPAALAVHTAIGGPLAYLCRGPACSAPVTSLAALAALLRDSP